MALNRIIQTALNMFTKLAEIISATCTCIISAAHMHNTCTHPRRCTIAEMYLCVVVHNPHTHASTSNVVAPRRAMRALKLVSIPYFARECTMVYRVCLSG